MTWHAKETIRGFYAITDPEEAAVFIDELIDDMSDGSMPNRSARWLGRCGNGGPDPGPTLPAS